MKQIDKEITVITADRPGLLNAWRELWRYSGLYVYLFKQTALRRFQETILGPIWLLLRSLIPSIVAIVVFTRVIPVPTNGVPYAVFYFGGFLLWGLFASIVSFVPRALRMNRGLMKKMYFPRLMIPFASLGVPFAEFAVTSCVFLVIAIYYAAQGFFHPQLGGQLLLFPFLVILTIVFAVSVGMVVGVLSLVARDVIFTLPYFLQLWMLLTPVLYSIQFVPEQWRWLIYILNPMAVIVEGAKWSLLNIGKFDYVFFMIANAEILLTICLATIFFLRAEEVFMDDI